MTVELLHASVGCIWVASLSLRPATARRLRARRQGRECPVYRTGMGCGSHHRSTGRRIGGISQAEAVLSRLSRFPRESRRADADVDPTATMARIAHNLTQSQLVAVAAYMSQLE